MNDLQSVSTHPSPDERIAHDPYDLRSIAERMLTNITCREFEAAQQDFKLLRRLRGKSPSLGLLEQAVFAGQRAITRPQSVFFLGPQPSSETLIKDLEDAVATCAQLVGQPAPVILVNCSNRQQAIYLTHREFAGFAVVTLSTHSPKFPNRLRRTLFHEVAHCFLASGARLLDEGFAIWFAENYSGVPTKKRVESASLPREGLRSLLLAAGKEGALFEHTGLDADEVTSVRRLAADLVAELVEKKTVGGLVALFERVVEASIPEEIVQQVENHLGRPLEQFNPRTEEAVAAHFEEDLHPRAARAVMEAWATRDRSGLSKAIRSIEGTTPRTPALLDALINLHIADATIAVQAGLKPEEKDVITIDTLLSEAATVGLKPGRLFTLRAKRCDLAIQLARPHMIKMVNASQKALHWYTKALKEDPKDPDLLIHYGIHEAHVPEQYGGGRTKALSYIGQATNDPLWGAWAKQLIADFDHDIVTAAPKAPLPSDKPSTPDTTTKAVSPPLAPNATFVTNVQLPAEIAAPLAPPSAPAAPARATAVQIRGLKVKVSADFDLDIPDLTVSAGEKIAIIGHNGAGKSVLLETLLSLRPATSGTITLLGGDTKRFRRQPDERRHLGASLQNINFPALVRVKEILRTHQMAYRIQSVQVSEALGLDELKAKEYRSLSKGQKQRVKVFLALAHRPKLAVLDEPSVGLDERYARALRDYLSSTEMSDTTVLIASHVAADIAITQRVVCLGGGRLIDSGNIRDLVDKHVGRYRARLSQTLSPAAREDLGKLDGLVRAPIDQSSGVIVYGRGSFEKKFINFLERHAVSAFSLEPSSTEDFLAYIAQNSK